MNKTIIQKTQNKNGARTGQLYYVIGASGAGKDSLIHATSAQAQKQDRILIAPRMVSRSKQPSSDDVELTEQAFLAQSASGKYLFSWQAHGFYYGIEREILSELKTGKNILVNGSRAYAQDARRIFPAVIIVGVEADHQHQQARLEKRGREDKSVITERLKRNSVYDDALQLADIVINNEQPLEQAAEDFLALIRAGS